ncbi:bifunctional hydroxymethylpyrimidine kinase/phosphomethylpyrimidine kinase, partial [Candidatus Bathyarchaeota archaeon]
VARIVASGVARLERVASAHAASLREALESLAREQREELVRALEEMELSVVLIDRAREPPEVAAVEGASLPWAVKEAVRELGRVPDAIYDLGAVGKEPMVRLLGRSAREVVARAIRAMRRASRAARRV